MLLHATCVVFDHQAVLLTGSPGIGKSDLALRLIDSGAVLVADDQVALAATPDGLSASPPPVLAGLLEIRHMGLVRMPWRAPVKIALAVELVDPAVEFERLPPPETIFLLDRALRKFRLHGYEASAAAKIRTALRYPLEPV